MDEREKLIQKLIKEKGGSRKDYLQLLDSIAYHESAHTMDPTIKQIGSGPGRGKYQFEEGKNAGGITAARRTVKYYKDNNIPVPKWLNTATSNDSLDATNLTSEQQDILFLGNMRQHPKADFSKVWEGKESIKDFWANYHWAGPDRQRKERLESFSKSLKSFESNQPKQEKTNSNILSEKESNDINKYIDRLNSTEPLDSNKTANTWGNMFSNVGKYFFDTKSPDLKISSYEPTKSSENVKYYSRDGMKEDVYRDLTSDKVKKDYNQDGTFNDIYKGLKSNGEDREHNADNSFPKNKAGYKGMYNLGEPSKMNKAQFNLGRYRTDAGEDEQGKYISFHDKYDWNGFQKGDPINFYDRIYENQWESYMKQNQKALGGELNTNNNDKKLNSFEGGGTHEQNQYGGIPQGIGNNGKQNTVEEGETSFDLKNGKYIFSNRIMMDGSGFNSNIDGMAMGGYKESNCGGKGQPPCKDLKSIEPYLSGDKYLINKEEIDISKNRVLNYLKSPGFDRILGKSENAENVKKIKKQRIEKVNNLKINQKNQISDKGPGYFYGMYNENTDKSVDLENYIYKGIPEHEINHASTDGNSDLNNFIKENIKKRVSHKRGYYNDPTEAQARIVNTRLLLKHSGIWDYNKGEFKEEDLQKLKIDLKKNPNKYKVQDFLDLKEHVNSDEDFIWLMNNVAQNNNKNTYNTGLT